MNNRFPSIVILGLVVVVLATIMNKWVFMGVALLGGAALAFVVWKLVERDMFTPPTVLIDEAKSRFMGSAPEVQPSPDPDEKEPDGTHRIRSDEQ